MNKKISVVIYQNNDFEQTNKTINSLISQTCNDVEIIVVNCLKRNINKFKKSYNNNNIIFISENVNNTLYEKIIGADKCNGDYILFLKSGDFLSVDLIRQSIEAIKNSKPDIIIYNSAFQKNNKLYIHDLCDINLNNLNMLDEYFKQEGLNYYFHMLNNKLYSKKIWRKVRTELVEIKNEVNHDFIISSLFFYYSKSSYKVDDGILTFTNNFNLKELNVNFDEYKNIIIKLKNSFNYIESFLKSKKIISKYQNNLTNWKKLYVYQLKESIVKFTVGSHCEILLNMLLDIYSGNDSIIDDDFFYKHTTIYDNRLDKLKEDICNSKIKVISFDIFDTLVVRPFLKPSDLFIMLDDYYRSLSNNYGFCFSKIRALAEVIAREKQEKKDPLIQEITLDSIYDIMAELYGLDKNILELLKNKEKELELQYCTRRNCTYDIYKLCLFLNKKVICTSDMYLPEDTIIGILNKNGYNSIYKLFLSSSIGKTKSTGDLYKHVLSYLNIDSTCMIHIGDNYSSDYIKAKENGIYSIHFIKTIDIMMNEKYSNSLTGMFTNSFPFWEDNVNGLKFLGIRSMLAVVANKYFDNPYRAFDKNTDFNADPYLIGYYCLGMYMFGVSKWLITSLKGKYDKISFMARDGFLPMEAYKIMKKFYNELPTENYLYVSRKALIPIIIEKKEDFYKLSDLIEYNFQSPKSIVKYLTNIINIDEDKLIILCNKEHISFEDNFKSLSEFNIYINLLINNFYNEKFHKENRNKLKSYFLEQLGDTPAVFDVGYSGRPEFYLSRLIDKNIDTFFLNINKDESLEYSRLGNFKINTFFPFKPTATGNAYEFIISKLAPSCISYTINDDSVEVIFEDYTFSYQVKHIMEIIQKASLEFINDITNIFGNNLDILYYQNYYIALPILAYFNSSKAVDKLPLIPILFEDDIGHNKISKMIDEMNKDLISKNQQTLYNLSHSIFKLEDCCFNFNYRELIDLISDPSLVYNPIVNLQNHNKLSKFIFYLLYDKQTLKRKVNRILSKIKKNKNL